MTGTAEVLDSDVLGDIAAQLAAQQEAWETRTGATPTERCYERILLTATHEAWVICWPAGTELELHDHGNSSGAFSVVAGHLDETTVVDGDAVVRRLARGGTASFGPSYVHAVANHGNRPATSVHVYSPPLEFMDFYDQADDGALLVTRHDPGEWNATE
ncbi:MAG: cysteine dioxygenase family protein [Ilumatobacteraceae bacterium]